jgi:hypothetical protein
MVPDEPVRELRYLAGILDDFDAHHERRPLSRVTDEGELEVATGRRFEEVKERVIRPALEAVMWRLERRGHHAWVEDVDGPRLPGADEDIAGELPDVGGLLFKVLPVADLRSSQQAPHLLFQVDLARERVDCSVGGLGSGRAQQLRFDALELADVDPAVVARLAIVLVEEVFLRRHRVLDEEAAAPTPDDWTPDSDGIIPRTGESEDWMRATRGRAYRRPVRPVRPTRVPVADDPTGAAPPPAV